MAELTPEARNALLESLAFFTSQDPGPFVSAVIVEPNESFFPDRFQPTADGLAAIAQRLLAYAGLGRYDADVTLDERALDAESMLPETRADLAGIEGRTVFFSCTQLGRADDAAFCLAHEVARAALVLRVMHGGDGPYRESEVHELLAPDDTEDERYRASILQACLGLGLLSAAGSHHYRQAGRTQGRMQVTAWQHVAYGGLSPEATSYLLAVQLTVRAIAGERRERLVGLLPEERQLEVRRELASLDRTTLIGRLGLPPLAEWPAEAAAPVSAPRTRKQRTTSKPKRAEPVFRVRDHHLAAGGALGTLGSLIAMAFVHGFVFPRTDGTLAFLSAAVIGGVLGAWAGAQRGWDTCSDCERRLSDDANRCRHCDAVIGGRIPSRDQRLEAREAWKKAQRSEMPPT